MQITAYEATELSNLRKNYQGAEIDPEPDAPTVVIARLLKTLEEWQAGNVDAKTRHAHPDDTGQRPTGLPGQTSLADQEREVLEAAHAVSASGQGAPAQATVDAKASERRSSGADTQGAHGKLAEAKAGKTTA